MTTEIVSDPRIASWPAGAGEMAARVRAFDWAATPLGPMADWPQSLKTIIETALAGGLPASVLWGPQLTQIYNDGFRQLMGEQHPAGLGQPTRGCWPEVWHINAPISEQVLAGETLTFEDTLYQISRHGGVEDARFTLSYSPLRDDHGAIAGVLVTVCETTARVAADRVLRENEARQAFLLRLSDALRPLDDADEIQMTASRIAGEWLDADRSYYAAVEPDGAHIVIPPGHFVKPGIPDVAGRYPMASFAGVIIDTLRANREILIEDTQTDTRLSGRERAAHAAIDVRAYAAVPLVKAGRLVAAFGALMSSPRAWTAEDVAIIRESAERTWAAVERGEAEAALRESEEQYRVLFETMDQGFCVIEKVATAPGEPSDFRYVATNPAFVRHTRLPDPVGQTILGLVPDAEPATMDAYDRVAATREPERFEAYVATLDMWMETEAYPSQESGQVAVIFTNITERKRAEDALRESEERLGAFAENSTDTLWIVDAETGQLEYLSPAFERMWGEPRAAVLRDIGRWAELVHPEDRAEAMQALAHGLAGEQHVSEYRIIRGDGDVRWIQDNGFPIRDHTGAVHRVAGIAQDVTAQRQARDELAARVAEATAELRALSRRLLTVQEEERRNLARELHDEIGQALTALQLLLGAASQAADEALVEAQAIVRELTARVSELSMDLRPAALDTLGLLPTLLWHVDRYQARTGIRVDLRRDGLERRFPPDVEIVAYRVVQEALTNVARHARTDAAAVQLLADAEALTVAVRDEGRGFVVANVVGAGGLSGMRERVELLGGILEIDAAPGEGATVTAEIPLNGVAAGCAAEDVP